MHAYCMRIVCMLAQFIAKQSRSNLGRNYDFYTKWYLKFLVMKIINNIWSNRLFLTLNNIDSSIPIFRVLDISYAIFCNEKIIKVFRLD